MNKTHKGIHSAAARLVKKLAYFSYIAGTLCLVIGIALSLGIQPVSASGQVGDQLASSRLRVQHAAAPAQQAAVPSVTFDQSDTAVCWLEPRWFTLTGTVSLPPEYDPAVLETSWYVVNPKPSTEPTYNETVVSNGDTFSLDVYWPGVNIGDQVVEIHAGAILKFNNVLISDADGVDYYWYDWFCPGPTPTSTTAPSNTPTATTVVTNTPSPTPTSTVVNTSTPTSTATATATLVNTNTPTPTTTGTLVNTNTPTSTATATATQVITATATPPTPPANSPTPTDPGVTSTVTSTPEIPSGSPTPTDPQNTLPPPGNVTGTPRLIVPPTGADLSLGSLPNSLLQRTLVNLGIGLLGLGMVLSGLSKKIK